MHKVTKKYPVFRSLAGVASLIFVVIAVTSLLNAHRLNQELTEKSEKPVIDSSVDLSQPGNFTILFSQSWQSCHGHSLNLEVPDEVAVGITPEVLLESLKYTWQIQDPEGLVVGEPTRPITGSWYQRNGMSEITIGYFNPSESGQYTFSCTVASGVPALEGVDQRLVSDHQLCIADMTPVLAEGMKGIVSFVAAGGLMLIIIVSTSLKRQKTPRNAIGVGK